MKGTTKKEEIKKHLKKVVNLADAQIDELADDAIKYFSYLSQPAKIADAILRTI